MPLNVTAEMLLPLFGVGHHLHVYTRCPPRRLLGATVVQNFEKSGILMHIQSLYRHPSRTPFSPPYTGRMDAPTVGSGRGTKKRPIRPGGQATDASVTRTGPNASKKDNYKAAMNSQSNSYDNIKPSGGLADCNDSGVLFVKRSPCSVTLFSPSKQSDIAETAAALLDKEYQSVPQDVDIIVEEEICCFICNQNLSLHDMASREAHVNACLDGSATEPQSFPEAPAAIAIEIDISEEGTTPSEHADLEHIGGLRAAELCCVVCGLDISRRGMFSRCFHIKRCARENMISVKDIIRMLSDHDDISGPADAEDVVEIIDCSDNSKATDINSMLMRNARHTVKDTSASASCSSIDKDIMRQMKQSAEAKNVNNFLMSAARENAGASKRRADEAEAAAGSREAKRGRNGWGKRQWNSNSSGNNAKLATNGAAEAYLQDGYAPDYKKIQYDGIEVPIIVDGFQYASTALSDTYFLTHFHSDHYGGLSSSFNCGKIYCSPATAALTQLRLRVSPHSLAPLALEVKHTVVVGGSKVFVTLIEANHCPGAVLLLFEFRSGKKILHTGDFRYNRDMLVRSPAMRELARSPSSNMRNLIVYLDTTYCDPQYCFPDQSLAIQAVVETVRREICDTSQQTLFVFGAYGIGKERVFMAVAQALGLKVQLQHSPTAF